MVCPLHGTLSRRELFLASTISMTLSDRITDSSNTTGHSSARINQVQSPKKGIDKYDGEILEGHRGAASPGRMLFRRVIRRCSPHGSMRQHYYHPLHYLTTPVVDQDFLSSHSTAISRSSARVQSSNETRAAVDERPTR